MNVMGKAFIASLVTLIVGVLGCAAFDKLNCPEIGVVLAVAPVAAETLPLEAGAAVGFALGFVDLAPDLGPDSLNLTLYPRLMASSAPNQFTPLSSEYCQAL